MSDRRCSPSPDRCRFALLVVAAAPAADVESASVTSVFDMRRPQRTLVCVGTFETREQLASARRQASDRLSKGWDIFEVETNAVLKLDDRLFMVSRSGCIVEPPNWLGR